MVIIRIAMNRPNHVCPLVLSYLAMKRWYHFGFTIIAICSDVWYYVAFFCIVLHNKNPSIVGSFSMPSAQYSRDQCTVVISSKGCGKKRRSQNLRIQVNEYRRLALKILDVPKIRSAQIRSYSLKWSSFLWEGRKNWTTTDNQINYDFCMVIKMIVFFERVKKMWRWLITHKKL